LFDNAMNVLAAQAIATREQILAQIVAVLGSISGVMGVYRDRGLMGDEKLPAIVVLDGREDIVSNIPPLKSVQMTPAIFRLQPQIFVICRERDDATNLTLDGQDDPIGPELSGWRDVVLAHLVNDPTLVSMLTTSGQIVYRGSQTDMATGRLLRGELQLFIDFHYIWQPPQVLTGR
jgi:hypothetical protein